MELHRSQTVLLAAVSSVLAAVALFAAAPGAARPGASAPPLPSGRVTGCEHFAFLRPSIAGGLAGPAREALKSWDGEAGGAFGPDGSYYQTDVNNSVIFRIRDGSARIFAGDGTRGGRDGPADQAQFDLGVGSYSDAGIACDAAGNVYVSEARAGRLRKIHRRDDGRWWVTTVAGGGDRMPTKGEWIPAAQMKVGCTSRFALTPDAAVTFAGYGGIYRIAGGKATLLADVKELKAQLGAKTAIHDWHVGGSHVGPDGAFYWMPGGGPNLLRFDPKTGRAERVAGIGKVVQGLDGPSLLESGFHTVLIAYRPDARVMYTCGGDESTPRRIRDGRAMSLHLDGRFRPRDPGARGRDDRRWRQMAAVQCLDRRGRLYAFTGDYGWGGWVVRFAFAEED
jgi:hypothetical protein